MHLDTNHTKAEVSWGAQAGQRSGGEAAGQTDMEWGLEERGKGAEIG